MGSFIGRITSLFRAKNEISATDAEDIRAFFRAGEAPITSSNAQKIATVFSCVDIKAKALSVIPIKYYKRTKNGKIEDRQDPLYNLLRYEPNPNITASMYKKMISQDLDLRGNHYTQIIRNGLGQIVALYPLISDKMEVDLSKNGKKIYKYDGKQIKSNQILHLYDIPDTQGIKGLSKIEYARQTLEFAKNASAHGNKIFKNGTNPSGVFETDETLNDDSYKRLKENIQDKYTGVQNSGTPLLLEGGLKFKPLTIKNSDAEWLESRKFNREEIASIFGVPVAMLNDASNTAYGNLEQKYLEFFSGTIFPITTLIEEKLRQDLLSNSQKIDNVIKFKYNTMLRVDAKTRADYYKTRFDTGSISPNEIREYEDENGFIGGDEYFVQLNLDTVKNRGKGNING